jgi:hypothetical protein
LDVVKMTRYSDLARRKISSKSAGPEGRGEGNARNRRRKKGDEMRRSEWKIQKKINFFTCNE